jgi:predicted nucleotidyltransferase
MTYEKEIAAAKRQLESSGKTTELKLLALGGSHSYGLSTPDSDVDLRGFAMPTARDVLLGSDFEQVQTMEEVDMCIYSLAKACKLMAQCNPNMIELIGLDDDAILITSPEYQTMCQHPEWFLSKRAAYTFGGYATAQLRRLQNAMARDTDTYQLAEGEIRSLEAALFTLPERYPLLKDHVKMSFDSLDTDDEKIRIMVTIETERVPATELAAFARQLDSARKSAETIGKNRRKESRKLAKHASHLIRLLHMGTEILSGKGVHTKRTEDAKLLLDIKQGMWLREDKLGRRTYEDAFWDLLNESEDAFSEAKEYTVLPDAPKLDELYDFIAESHKRVVTR